MAEFTLTHLKKTDNLVSPNHNNQKFFLSYCKGKITESTPTTENWLKIIRAIKFPIKDYDKSRVLLGNLEKYGAVAIKIGDSDEITEEYEMSKVLHKIKGFVKYICYFECSDDFRQFPSNERNTMCQGTGSSMKIILMPYFPLGSIAKYKWDTTNVYLLKSCLKHSIMSYLMAFYVKRIIHNDFHTGNILLKGTKSVTITYEIPDFGLMSLPTQGFRPWIMDFEKSAYADLSSYHNSMWSLNKFYYDINNSLFGSMPGFINNIDMKTFLPIQTYLNNLQMTEAFIKRKDLDKLFTLIDAIILIN